MANINVWCTMQLSKEFPQDFLIELKGLSPDFVGRITVHRHDESFMAEVDIVQNESGKIYARVKDQYEGDDARELVDLGVHYLRKYMEERRRG